jgi:CubicO group peptidase (beta-lactamase class C family)
MKLMRAAHLAAALALISGHAVAQDTRPFQSVADVSAFKPVAALKGVAHPSPIAAAPPERRSVPVEAFATAKAYSDAHAGKALLVWQGGKLQYEWYAEGLNADSRFNVFSITKTVLGLAYGVAVRDGIIQSIDDPVGKYLEEWRGDPRGAITLRQLLTMSSGLTLYSLARPTERTFAMTYGPDVTRLALETPAAKPPGLEFEYNNVDSQIAGVALARAVEAAGQGDYPAWLSKVLWAPMGQTDAAHWLEHEGGYPRFFAGIMAPARDWLRIGLLIKDKGRANGRDVLPASWIDEMTAPSAHNPNYGLQVWMGQPYRREVPGGPTSRPAITASQPYLIPDLIFLNGAFGQRVYVSRALDLVIVRMGEPRPDWDDSVIPNAIAAGLKR